MDEWVDVAYGPDAGATAPVASLASNDGWEDVVFGPPAASTATFGSDLPAIASRGLKGVSDLVSFGENMFSANIPAIMTGKRGLLSDRFEKGLDVLGVDTNAVPQTPAGKVAGEIAYYAPSAVLPGGSVGGKVASTVGAGSFSAIADMFGAGEGGKAAAGMVGALTPMGLGSISSLFSRASKAIAPITAEQEAIKSLGLTAAKIGKMGGVDKVDDVIQTAVSKNVFAGAGPEDWAAANQKAIESIGDETGMILKSADSVQTNVEFPKWSNTKEFIEKNPFQKTQLGEQFDRRFQSINELWDGTISGLNSLKQKLYGIAYSGTTDSKLLDRAIAKDIKEAVETQAGSLLGDDAKNLLIAKNAEQGRHLTIQDAIEAATNKAAAQDLKGPGKLSLTSTPVLTTGGAIGSVLSGSPEIATALIGAAIAKGALNSDIVRGAASGTLRGGSAIAEMFGGGLSSATALASAAGSGVDGLQETLRSSQTAVPQLPPAKQEEYKNLQSQSGQSPDIVPISQSPSGNSSPELSAISDIFQRKGGSIMSDVFSKVSGALNVPSELVDAVIKTESSGRKDAVSEKGAVGLMQVMPATAKDIAKELGIDKYDLKDPDTNKLFGSYYLSKLMNQFGDVALALTAYHSGPGRVARLLKQTGGSSLADILPHLGPEGKKYAEKVMAQLDTETPKVA